MDFNEINEMVQMILKRSHPNKDVRVVLDGCQHGGIWYWKSSLQLHVRTPLKDKQAEFSCYSEFMDHFKSIDRIHLTTEQIQKMINLKSKI